MKNTIKIEIGRQVGIAQSTLSNILNGRRRPSWNVAKKLANVTGSSPVDWMEANPDSLKKIINNITTEAPHDI